ncbi:MAG: MogA/MoaB family molybdenum cofactor biosynthesis protein [Nitrospirae bacterium]|nr:MogA/MoaB family molybdenum cofactor biosynthesis protein [Nitrospirota bacterium]
MIRAAVLTISDKGSRGERTDESGPAIAELLKSIGCEVIGYDIVPDDKEEIKAKLISLAGRADLILTTGGTGLSPRDVTPEATLEVIEREVPGLAELMRAEGMKLTRRAALSRAVCGTLGASLIVNLPGSPRAVKENLRFILDLLPHGIEKLKGSTEDCARPLP